MYDYLSWKIDVIHIFKTGSYIACASYIIEHDLELDDHASKAP